MWSRLLLAAGLLAAAIFVWFFFKSEGFVSKSLEVPSSAPLIEANEYRGPANTVPGGPNPPAVASSGLPEQFTPEPDGNDPYSESVESANAPENLRFPERSFGPGVIPESTKLAVQGGLANASSGHSAAAFQQFSPEFATNGGTWLDSVTANEDNSPYSAF